MQTIQQCWIRDFGIFGRVTQRQSVLGFDLQVAVQVGPRVNRLRETHLPDGRAEQIAFQLRGRAGRDQLAAPNDRDLIGKRFGFVQMVTCLFFCFQDSGLSI